MFMSTEKSDRRYYHYIYKIYFLKGSPEGRYYYGKRSFYGGSIEKDHYTGSGNFCFAYFKKYGIVEGETYRKEIIEENPDMDTNRDREDFWIGDLWKTDPLCMNQGPGGKGCAEHKTLVECQNAKKKYINQYDLEGHFIKTWFGIRDAARELKINRSGITACINGRKPTAFGYQWKLYEGSTDDIAPFYFGTPVDQYALDGEFIATYESIMDAARAVGLIKHSDFIGQCCKGTRKATRNSIWRYAGELLTKEHIDWVNSRKEVEVKTPPINQYTRGGEFVAQYKSISEAERKTGISSSTISSCILKKPLRKTAGGYVWKVEGNDFVDNDVYYQGVAVSQFDLEGNFIANYNTIPEAAAQFENPMSAKTGINSCCLGKAISAMGYFWRYKGGTVTAQDIEAYKNRMVRHVPVKGVIKYASDGVTVLAKYQSVAEACKSENVKDRALREWCLGNRHPKDKTIWKYVEPVKC